MEGQEEEVGGHVDDIDVIGVEEATAAAAAETPASSQAKRKSPWLLGAPMVSKPAKTKRGKSGSAREERLKEPQALIKRSGFQHVCRSEAVPVYHLLSSCAGLTDRRRMPGTICSPIIRLSTTAYCSKMNSKHR